MNYDIVFIVSVLNCVCFNVITKCKLKGWVAACNFNLMFATATFIQLCLLNSNMHCQSVIFQPCTFVRHFSVLHFPPRDFLVRHFLVLHFQATHFLKRSTPLWLTRSRETHSPKGTKFCHEKLESLWQPTMKISWF